MVRMRISKKKLSGWFILAIVLLQAQLGSACSLALHDWKLAFYLKIPLSAPLFPLAELSSLPGKLPESSAGLIYWVSNHNLLSCLTPVLLPFFSDWPAKLPWITVDAGKSLTSLAHGSQKQAKTPLIIGSDKCFLKLALFSDANAAFNCHQLVILQSNRIRAVFPDKSSPWAQEINGQSWVSLIFYQLPIPGRILSFSAFPVSQIRKSIYENHSYVEALLSQNQLMRRPDLVVDPYAFDFPELPE